MMLTGRQRRRLARMLRRVRADSGGVFLTSPCEHRDARRLAKMGLACPVVSKRRPWTPHGIGEITLFATRAEASRRYGSHTMPPRSRRGC